MQAACLLLSARATAQPEPPFAKEIAAIVEAERRAPPPRGGVVFTGSSSIRLWKTLAADFPTEPVVNHGFGGSHIEHSTLYADRLVWPLAPRLVVIYAGGNDIHADKTPARVAADFRAFVRKVHERLPHTRVAFISIAPNPARFAELARVKEANALIRRFTETDPRLGFIDVFPHMLGPDGQPRPELYGPDRLHMTETGYALWKKIVGPVIDRGVVIDQAATPAKTTGAVLSWKGAPAGPPGPGVMHVRLVGALAAAPGKSGELTFDLRRGPEAVRRLIAERWGNRAQVSAEVRVSPSLTAGGKRFWQRPHRARLFVVDAAGGRLYLPNASIVDRPASTDGWLTLEGLVTADVPMPLGFTDARFDPARVVQIGVCVEASNRVGEVVEGTIEVRELRVALREAITPRVRPEDPAVRAGEVERAKRMEARMAALGLPARGPAVGVNLAWPTARSPEGEEMQLYGRLLDGGTKWWDSFWDLGEEAVARSVREDFREIRTAFARPAGAVAGEAPPIVRIWLFGDLRNGVTFDADGIPTGVSERSRKNMDLLLKIAAEEKVLLAPVLLDFGLSDGVGRSGPDGAWVVGERPDLVIDADRRRRLVAVLEQFVRPIASHPAVLAWDVMNEPENAAAVVTPRHFADLQALMVELVDAVHRAGGFATIGHRNPVDARFFRGRAASDLGQAHYYPLLETRPNPSRLGMSFRDVFGPLPGGWGELPAEPGRIAQHLGGARRAGHRIFWFWAWRGHQESGDGFAVKPYAEEIRRALGRRP